MRQIMLISLLISNWIGAVPQQAPIQFFFDLGDTLIAPTLPSQISALGGLYDMSMYLLNASFQGLSPWHASQTLKEKFLTIIDMTMGVDDQGAHITDGRPAAVLFVKLWKGIITPLEARAACLATIKKLSHERFFDSLHEEQMITKLCMTTFTPERFASLFSPISGVEQLLEDLSKARDKKGNPYRFFLLSNFDLSYSTIAAAPHLRSIFNYFSPKNSIISSAVGLIKPSPDFFKKAEEELNIKINKNSLFIDDRPENIQAWEQQGGTGIVVANKNIAHVRKKLEEFGILTTKEHTSYKSTSLIITLAIAITFIITAYHYHSRRP